MEKPPFEISNKFEHGGFRYETYTDGLFIFRRNTEGRLQTFMATPDDVLSGNIYKMIDRGFSRF